MLSVGFASCTKPALAAALITSMLVPDTMYRKVVKALQQLGV